jgi:hypothetical protein
MSGVGAFEFVLICLGFVFILGVGLSMVYWYSVEDYLLKMGWIPWLNKLHERENEKLDQCLKEYYERQKERGNE